MKGEPPEKLQEMLADRLIREAMESGDFDDLPGAGRPLPGAGTADDEYWWLRDWVKRNQLNPDLRGQMTPKPD